MKSQLLSLALACIASAPAMARTLPVETIPAVNADPTQTVEAVASACVTNTTDYRIVFLNSWGLEHEGFHRVVLNPGDSSLYRLVLSEPRADLNLTIKFPANPTTGETAEAAIPATWGTVREDDCTKLPSFNFVLQPTDGGGEAFALVANTPN